MAIEPNRLVVRSTPRAPVSRLRTPPPVVTNIDPTEPGTSYWNGSVYFIRNPEYEGQVVIVDNGDFVFTMYVAVRKEQVTGLPDTALLWKPCIFASGTLDPRTGKPYDPLASFYNVLAN